MDIPENLVPVARAVEMLPAGSSTAKTPGQAQAEAAIRIFRAAAIKAPFGWDGNEPDAMRLWSSALGGYTLAAVMEAAEEWVRTPGAEFPTLAEFETVVMSKQRRIDRPLRDEFEDRDGCPECGETRENPTGGWVYTTDPTEPGTDTVRPCGLCRPDQHAMWKAGHNRPREGTVPCHCRHPLCRFSKKAVKA